MDWIGALLGGGAKSVLEGVGGLAKNIREAIVGPELSSDQKAQIAMQLQAMEAVSIQAAATFDTTQMQGQIELAKIDAASSTGFQKNWRPFIGWVCGVGLVYDLLLRPILPWAVKAAGYVCETMPALDASTFYGMLMGMLGLGGMRTFEKYKQVAK